MRCQESICEPTPFSRGMIEPMQQPVGLVQDSDLKVQTLVRLAGIAQGNTVLVPGCGSGFLNPAIAEQVGSEGRVISCDVSAQMIRRLQKRRLPRNVFSLVASPRSLPVQDEFCDCIFCVNAFHQFADKAQCLKEFQRVLKKQGHLFIADLDQEDPIGSGRQFSPNALLPSRPAMSAFLKDTGFRLLMLRDNPQGYVLRAVRLP